jgi:tRNA threonylcarbamoyl adenosine modification protein (Sua5/YciO/YrdC/YwlC family)
LLYDCADEARRKRGISVAVRTVRAGRLVVLPTDTVYGIGADAFSPNAIAKLLEAKGRGPDMPVPVLVGTGEAWTGVAVSNEAAEALAAVFWPGALSLLCREQPSLSWNLGDTGGTVVVRMPEHEVALDLLRETGPMGVSSANLSGQPPARTAQEARDQLGNSVAVYLEAGPTRADIPSTIVDVTGDVPRVLRAGAISLEQLREVVPEILAPENDDAAEVSSPAVTDTATPAADDDASDDDASGAGTSQEAESGETEAEAAARRAAEEAARE